MAFPSRAQLDLHLLGETGEAERVRDVRPALAEELGQLRWL